MPRTFWLLVDSLKMCRCRRRHRGRCLFDIPMRSGGWNKKNKRGGGLCSYIIVATGHGNQSWHDGDLVWIAVRDGDGFKVQLGPHVITWLLKSTFPGIRFCRSTTAECVQQLCTMRENIAWLIWMVRTHLFEWIVDDVCRLVGMFSQSCLNSATQLMCYRLFVA